MSLDTGQVDVFDHVTCLLHHASTPSEALFREVATACCQRLPTLDRAGKARPIVEFVSAGAWIDATLAIIESKLPRWTLRRLLYEDGEWRCSLSLQPDLPIEFDDTADACHAALPLAVLAAFVEGCRRAECATRLAVSKPDQRAAKSGIAMCCDNFA